MKDTYSVTGLDTWGRWSRSSIFSPFKTKKEAEKYLKIAKIKYDTEYYDIKIIKNFKWKPK